MSLHDEIHVFCEVRWVYDVRMDVRLFYFTKWLFLNFVCQFDHGKVLQGRSFLHRRHYPFLIFVPPSNADVCFAWHFHNIRFNGCISNHDFNVPITIVSCWIIFCEREHRFEGRSTWWYLRRIWGGEVGWKEGFTDMRRTISKIISYNMQ